MIVYEVVSVQSACLWQIFQNWSIPSGCYRKIVESCLWWYIELSYLYQFL